MGEAMTAANSPRLSAEAIAELRVLDRMATPATWRYVTGYGIGAGGHAVVNDLASDSAKQNPNCALVVAMRNALPALLAAAEENDRLREQVRRLEQELGERSKA